MQYDLRYQFNQVCDKLATLAHTRGNLLTHETLNNPLISLKDKFKNQIVHGNINKVIQKLFNQKFWKNLSMSSQGKLIQHIQEPIEDDLYQSPIRLLIKYHIKLRTNSLPINHIKAKFSHLKSKVSSLSCPLCNDPDESIEHYLFKCRPLFNLRLFNLKEIKTIVASHFKDHATAITKVNQVIHEIERDLKYLHSSENVPSVKSANIIGFFSGFLSSPSLITIKKVYSEYLKIKKSGQNSLKITWSYKHAVQKFRQFLAYVRLKEYQCWKIRIKHAKAL